MRNKPRLLTPGPTPLPDEVRLALAQDMIHHRKPGFKKIVAEIREELGGLFQTAEPVIPLAASGTGAMTAAVTNCFAPGEKVVVVEGGYFGERWRHIAESHGLEVVSVPVEWGRTVKPTQVEEALEAHPDAGGVLVQVSETSVGVLHPVRELAEVAHRKEALLIADGISAVGISPCPMDKWGLDCLLTGSQKGLMLPPGLSLIALSQRAWAKVEAVQPRNFYFNLLGERKKLAESQTLFTPAVNLFVGLHVSLRLFKEAGGLEEIFRKQWALTCLAREGVTAMGLDLLVPESFTWGLTSIRLPAGMDGNELLRVAAERFDVIMAGGQGQFKGRIVRIGHMGWVDWADVAAGLHAFAEAYRSCGGYISSRDYLEQGLRAYEEALVSFSYAS